MKLGSNPLTAVKLSPHHHPAPAWPNVQTDIAPSNYIRVPDSPIIDAGAATPQFTTVPQHWGRSGWVLGWRAAAYVAQAHADLGGATLWTPSDEANAVMRVALAINSHNYLFTNSQEPSYLRLLNLHRQHGGWLPWMVRVNSGDNWAWSYWRTAPGAFDGQDMRAEIGLLFVSDEDLAAQVNGMRPSPAGTVTLSRPKPTRWFTPPEDDQTLAAGDYSSPRRIDWQQGPGNLIEWCGAAKALYTDGETVTVSASDSVDATIEAQVAFNDQENLILSGESSEWMSLYLLFGGRGNRHVMPLCRRMEINDQLTSRLRNVGPVTSDDLPFEPDLVFGYRYDADPCTY